MNKFSKRCFVSWIVYPIVFVGIIIYCFLACEAKKEKNPPAHYQEELLVDTVTDNKIISETSKNIEQEYESF